jgi:hypothetical protein
MSSPLLSETSNSESAHSEHEVGDATVLVTSDQSAKGYGINSPSVARESSELSLVQQDHNLGWKDDKRTQDAREEFALPSDSRGSDDNNDATLRRISPTKSSLALAD